VPFTFLHSSAGLVCDGVSVAAIADALGTPAYVYSAESVRLAYRRLDDAFAGYPHRIHFALKSNSTLGLLRLLRDIGSNADANSMGELQVAERAGFTPEQVVFTGVGKTRDELAFAIAQGVATINAESAGELDRIADLADAQGHQAHVAVRVNPDIDARSHPKISTGLKVNKFGVPIEEARQLYLDRRGRASLRFVGVHIHIGSQITTTSPMVRAAEALVGLANVLRDDGVPLEHLDLGGGLGVSYDGQSALSEQDYANAVLPVLRRSGLPVVLEPGRAVVAAAGALVATVVDVKTFPGGRRFAVLDAGMTELLRPAMYGAFHRIVPVAPVQDEARELRWDVVGPICESSDVLGRDCALPALTVGDRLAILDAGAYGAAMASNYNRRLLCPEALVDAGAWRIIRRRQTLGEMLALED
jgi:diaminopimelate decarboxylase